MTISELIDRLKEMDPDMPVLQWSAARDVWLSRDGWQPVFVDVVKWDTPLFEGEYRAATSKDDEGAVITALEL